MALDYYGGGGGSLVYVWHGFVTLNYWSLAHPGTIVTPATLGRLLPSNIHVSFLCVRFWLDSIFFFVCNTYVWISFPSLYSFFNWVSLFVCVLHMFLHITDFVFCFICFFISVYDNRYVDVFRVIWADIKFSLFVCPFIAVYS